MKPIALSIKGLHSFREEQTIDFEGLSGAGVSAFRPDRKR